jgi:hypothetical protein
MDNSSNSESIVVAEIVPERKWPSIVAVVLSGFSFLLTIGTVVILVDVITTRSAYSAMAFGMIYGPGAFLFTLFCALVPSLILYQTHRRKIDLVALIVCAITILTIAVEYIILANIKLSSTS